MLIAVQADIAVSRNDHLMNHHYERGQWGQSQMCHVISNSSTNEHININRQIANFYIYVKLIWGNYTAGRCYEHFYSLVSCKSSHFGVITCVILKNLIFNISLSAKKFFFLSKAILMLSFRRFCWWAATRTNSKSFHQMEDMFLGYNCVITATCVFLKLCLI